VADGLKMTFECCAGLTKQSMYYNGWKAGHYILNLFVFSMDGRIILCALNAPGSVHDSTLAEWCGMHDKLEAMYQRTGGVCCLDSAFAAASAPYLMKSSGNVTKAKNPVEVRRISQATSVRQASEWGMRAIQGAFPRTKDTLQYEEAGERKIYLMLMALLYNTRLELVGLNEIRNVYLPAWSRDFDNLMDGYL